MSAADWSIIVVGIEEGNFLVKVADNEEDFLKTTVKQLKKKISDKKSGMIDPAFMRLLFAGKQLEDEDSSSKEERTLKYYNIQKRSAITVVVRVHGGSDTPTLSSVNRVPVPPTSENKEYPSSFALKFTDEPDCLDPFPDPNAPKRVKMNCGHGVEPNTLTAYCRSLLDQHIFKFTCPAIDSKTKKKCGKEWEYADVRLAALLNDAEMQYFESKMSEYAASQYCDIKECPGCRSFTERIDLNNLRVHCPICTKKKGRSYDFCWQCTREWTGPTTSSVKCGSELCIHPDIPSIRDAPNVQVCEQTVPNRRACPTCGKVVEHTTEACKNVICPRCKKEFCFLCLELTVDCQKAAPGSWYKACAKPVAPKQTVIPVWSRNI